MLVVHAGPHKTATTYIQNNLEAAEAELAAKGWDYPTEGRDGWSAHHSVAHGFRFYSDKTNPQRLALAAEAARSNAAGRNVLLSGEGFCRWGVNKLKVLREIMGVETMDVIYVIRDPFDIFYSYWAEEVKQGYPASFANRFTENFNDPNASRLLNPMVDLAPLLRQPEIRLRIIPFTYLKAHKIDIYSHLCETCLGLPGMEGKSSVAKNESLPIELTEFLRLITAVHAKGERHIGSDFRHQFMRVTKAAERAEIVSLIRNEVGGLMKTVTMPGDSVVKARLEQMLKKRLAGLWTIDPGDETLFTTDEKTYQFFDEFDLWMNKPVRDVAEDILARIGA